MHVFLQKSPLCRSHFFEWLKTAISSNACGTVTLKSLLPRAFFTPRVHPRPRKRRSRCTLDCGFQTSESPALRGFEAERAPIRGTSLYLVLLSNGLHHSKNLPEKFGFLPIDTPANIAKKLPPQRCFKPLFIAFFNFSHKRSTFAFTPESGYTLAFRKKIAHKGLHGETGGLLSAVTALSCAAREIVPKEQPEEADARLWRVSASSGVAALPGCVTLFVIWQCCCFSLCAQEFLHAQGEGVSLPSAYSACY